MRDSQVKTGPAEVGHTHADVSIGALRASVFGAMDGLVTNIALVAGAGGSGATSHFIVLTGRSADADRPVEQGADTPRSGWPRCPTTVPLEASSTSGRAHL